MMKRCPVLVAFCLPLLIAATGPVRADTWPTLPVADATVRIPAQESPHLPGARTVKVYLTYPGGSLENVNAETGLMLSLHNWGGTGAVGTADPEFLAGSYNVIAICVDYLQSGDRDKSVPYDCGYLQALDSLRALYFVFDGLEKLGKPFARGRVFATGGSGGANVSLMANKLAPRTFACIIECSGRCRLSDDIAFGLPGGSPSNARYSQDPASRHYLTTDAQEIRFVGRPDHLLKMKFLGNTCKVIVSHGSTDHVCPVEQAREMVANMRAAEIDVEAHFITESDIDAKAFKNTGHGVGDRTLIVDYFARKYLSPNSPTALVRKGKCDFELGDEKVRYATGNGEYVISYKGGYPVGRFEAARNTAAGPRESSLSAATVSKAWLTSMDVLYTGPAVETREGLKAYTGRAAAERIIGKDRKTAYLLNYKQLGINYGEAVDFQLRRQQVILCPQTADFLYSRFTPTDVKLQPGTHPILEKVVAKATAHCKTQREKALALMRFCRDLYKHDPDADFVKYVYGGTEEQLIDKPEILCECLGRLMVALCEVAGMPGRVVMHDIGGHICSEILIDGHWAYIDPRCGVYFLKPDGQIASVLELCQNPSIIRAQPDHVKAEVSDQWTWHYRAWKCENMYFHPKEVNGFENYSLSETEKYSYGQLPREQVLAAGLMDVNKEYVAATRRVFGLTEDGTRHTWRARKLRKLPIAYRHDGFSPFFAKPPMTRKDVEQRLIDPFEGTNVEFLVWGLGPGSVFCFDTKVGQVFGEGLTKEQRTMVRQGDLWVHENVTNLIRQGTGPLRISVERGRQIGLPIFARLEMNHEYGPADPKNWKWVAFVGDLNKKHPEYRIDGTVLLDFKHQEVRDFKLAIFREAAEAGADGVSLDFAVYPPFFTKPDPAIMTQFLRDVRAMLDEVGKRQNRRIQIMARVANVDYMPLGLDWKTWMREHLVDIIVPTKRHQRDYFYLHIEEFVSLANQTGVRVVPSIWHALGFVDTDPHPTRPARYDKPKTKGMFYAQALMLHRAGADGIQLAQSADGWRIRPWFNDLADPDRILFADKHYMVDPISMRQCRFKESGSRTVGLRIGDDISAAHRESRSVKATLVVYCRPLKPGEKLEIRVNGSEPVTISGDSDEERSITGEESATGSQQFYQRDWWKRGEHKLEVASGSWKLGQNDIELIYSNGPMQEALPLSITWIDLLLDYDEQ